jgi:hypothetical protein
MIANAKTPDTQEHRVDSLAAELAVAAYRVALGTRTRGTWLDLELELWRVLAEKLSSAKCR